MTSIAGASQSNIPTPNRHDVRALVSFDPEHDENLCAVPVIRSEHTERSGRADAPFRTVISSDRSTTE
jgi:hypothetical protein